MTRIGWICAIGILAYNLIGWGWLLSRDPQPSPPAAESTRGQKE